MFERYFFADAETTGVKPSDKIVELAYACATPDLEILYRNESLIDPEIPIPSAASAVNGITNKIVHCEPTIEEFMAMHDSPMLTDTPAVLVAHNASFDFRYFHPWMHKDSTYLCTLRLAKKVYPGLDSYKLQALKYSLELPEVGGNAHRAGADVDMLLNLVEKIAYDTNMSLEQMLVLAQAPVEVKNMPFGKHQGKPLAEVPADYLGWYLRQEKTDPDLVASILTVHPSLKG